MPDSTVPVGVRLTREQIARLTASGQKISPAVRDLIDFEPMAPVHAAALLGVAASNLNKVPGLPTPRWSPEAGDKVTGRVYDARLIRALAVTLAEERARREAGCGHEPMRRNKAGRCCQCETERVREYKQAQKAAA